MVALEQRVLDNYYSYHLREREVVKEEISIQEQRGVSYACAPSDKAINGSRDQSFSSTGSDPSSERHNSISGPLEVADQLE
jgi:hypothetical protein